MHFSTFSICPAAYDALFIVKLNDFSQNFDSLGALHVCDIKNIMYGQAPTTKAV